MTTSTAIAKAFKMIVRSMFWWAALVSVGWAQAQLSIQSVTATVESGGELVRIHTTAPLAQAPVSFATQSPARIAIDFPGALNGMGRSSLDFNQGNLRSATVVEAAGKTRVILSLDQSAPYRTRVEGQVLIVQLDNVAVPSTAAQVPLPGAVPVSASTASRPPSAPLSQIDFRRGSDQSGRIIVQLGSRQTGVDIRTQGKNLLLELTQSSLPAALRRRLDVTDFGTPVKSITSTQVGDRVQILIEPTGNWEHSAYQTDQQLVVEIRGVKPDPARITSGPAYSGEKLTLNFQNIEVRALLQVIADFTDFNIITSDSVAGNVTLRLKDVPWDQAMDIILQAKGLGMRKTGNVIWVAPREEILAKEKAELEAQQQIRTLEPVRTQSFRLNFAKADEVAKQLTTAVGTGDSAVRLLSKQGSVFAETRTNQLFVTDIGSKLEEVQALIKKVDVPVKQVLIEARIVEAEDNFGKELGARFGARVNSPVTVASVNGNPVQSTFGFGSIGATAAGNAAVTNVPVTADNFGTFALSLFNPSASRLLNLEIAANESDRRLKTISSPRVVTADQKQATIEDGRKFPFLKRDADGNTTTEFIDASLKLIVTPQITPDGDVIMELNVKNDSPIIFNGETAIQTKSVNTQVLVENGGTVVIGGIYVQEDTKNVEKVPVLGDVPIFGNLFASRQTNQRKSELLVFITPRVISDNLSLMPRR